MNTRLRHHPGLNLGETDSGSHAAAQPVVFGFWVFMMSDLVVFALLFATYAAMSQQGIAGGPGPQELFGLTKPFIETLLLLASSFTFGLVSLALKYSNDRARTALWLVVTFVLGAAFVAMEAHDFWSLIHRDNAPPQRSGFLSSFYLLVATHGLHVSAGLVWILVMLVQLAVFGPVRAVKLRIMRLGIYWHMLDIVWIGIFTFVFLFGVMQ